MKGRPHRPIARPVSEPGTARGRRTQAALLASAESVFGEQGYEQTSISAITRAAGVAQGTFYIYFPSKHAVFVKLIEEFQRGVRAHLAGAVRDLAPGAPRSVVERRGLEAFFEYVIEHPSLYRVVKEAEFVAPETYRWYYRSFIGAYIDRFNRSSPDAPATFDPEVLAWAVIGLADVFGRRWVIWERQLPPPEVIDQLAGMLSLGIDRLLEGDLLVP